MKWHATLERCKNNDVFNLLSTTYKFKNKTKQVTDIQRPEQLAIIKTIGHSKSDTMEAKRNQLADAVAEQAALNMLPVQSWDCPLLSINLANPIRDFFLQVQEVPTKKETQIRQQKGEFWSNRTNMA